MADRTSAGLFGSIFEAIADGKPLDPEDIWDMTGGYDFSPYQMGCDDALEKLGLLHFCKNDACPDYDPEEYEPGVHVYGPIGTECDSCGEIPKI
jgi:hypothetical protein